MTYRGLAALLPPRILGKTNTILYQKVIRISWQNRWGISDKNAYV